jgi:hypothetical protein
VRFPGHSGLARQDRHQHAAVEHEGEHAGGDRGAVAAQQAQHEHQEHQAMGHAAGAQVVRAGLAQQPRAQPGADPQQRQGAHGCLREGSAGQGAEQQQRGAVGDDVLHRAVQQRRAGKAEQALRRPRGDGQEGPVERVLGDEAERQQQHEAEAGIQRATQALAVLLALRIDGKRRGHSDQLVTNGARFKGARVCPPAAAAGSAPRSRR